MARSSAGGDYYRQCHDSPLASATCKKKRRIGNKVQIFIRRSQRQKTLLKRGSYTPSTGYDSLAHFCLEKAGNCSSLGRGGSRLDTGRSACEGSQDTRGRPATPLYRYGLQSVLGAQLLHQGVRILIEVGGASEVDDDLVGGRVSLGQVSILDGLERTERLVVCHLKDSQFECLPGGSILGQGLHHVQNGVPKKRALSPARPLPNLSCPLWKPV